MKPKAPRTARGYGRAHQQMRAAVAPIVRAGGVICPRCGKPIDPMGDWDLGHSDDRARWTGPEHVHCNRSAGAREGNRRRRRARAHVDPPPPPGW